MTLIEVLKVSHNTIADVIRVLWSVSCASSALSSKPSLPHLRSHWSLNLSCYWTSCYRLRRHGASCGVPSCACADARDLLHVMDTSSCQQHSCQTI